MLVLKRKVGESLMIGDDVELIILERDGDTVKIGIRAPRHVTVYRKEIHDEIKEANLAALQSTDFSNLLEEFRNMPKKPEKQ